MISWFDRETVVTMITTKSLQLTPNPGNREPIITEPSPGDFGNAVGLRNPGIAEGVRELSHLRSGKPLGALLTVSLSATGVDDFVELAQRSAPVADLIELNYSCPHATKGYGADIGRDAEAIAMITEAVVNAVGDLPVLVKLTPNVPKIEEMACTAIDAGAAGVTAINTVGPVVYLHPDSGTPILSNPPDGRGGKSGAWIGEIAVEAVATIREAIGAAPLIVGMGGVSTRADAERIAAAGADIVGIGSALGRVHQRFWPTYIEHLAGKDTESRVPLRDGTTMDHRRHRVTARRELGDRIFEIDLVPPVSAEIGQTVFLWIPGLGEKPFAPAVTTSAVTTFLIKRRGPLTEALGTLDSDSVVFVRGPYGDRWFPSRLQKERPETGVIPRYPPSRARSALLIGAGSGVATLPKVADLFRERGVPVTSIVGVREEITNGAVIDALAEAGRLEIVPDEGEIGRVLSQIPSLADECGDGIAWTWICGPERFMDEAARRVVAVGVGEDHIYLSLERMVRCGVGMCGECHHHGRLTCQFGTVVTAKEAWS